MLNMNTRRKPISVTSIKDYLFARNLSKNLREISPARNCIQISFFLYDRIYENRVNSLCNQMPHMHFDFTTPKGPRSLQAMRIKEREEQEKENNR